MLSGKPPESTMASMGYFLGVFLEEENSTAAPERLGFVCCVVGFENFKA